MAVLEGGDGHGGGGPEKRALKRDKPRIEKKKKKKGTRDIIRMIYI